MHSRCLTDSVNWSQEENKVEFDKYLQIISLGVLAINCWQQTMIVKICFIHNSQYSHSFLYKSKLVTGKNRFMMLTIQSNSCRVLWAVITVLITQCLPATRVYVWIRKLQWREWHRSFSHTETTTTTCFSTLWESSYLTLKINLILLSPEIITKQ